MHVRREGLDGTREEGSATLWGGQGIEKEGGVIQVKVG